MGSCASVHNNSGSTHKPQIEPNNNNDVNNNNNNNSINENKSCGIVEPQIISVGSKSRVSPFNSITSRHTSFGGSKDENFYDTQAWLDSDCDDDFYSVNGDFSSRGSTPGRGNTPGRDVVTSSKYIRTFSPHVNRALFDARTPLRGASNRSKGTTPPQRSVSAASPRASVTSTTEIEPASKLNGDTTTTKRGRKLVDLFRESIRERGDEEVAFAGYVSSPNVDALPHTSSTNSLSSSGVRTSRKRLSKVVHWGCFSKS